MSLTRKIQKKVELNQYEADMLKIKARQCGIKEGRLLRELITGFAPAEKPGKEFYDAMEEIRKIGININQIARVANTNGYIDEEWLKELAAMLENSIVELKKMVTWARPYNRSFYDDYILAMDICRKEGLPEPSPLEVENIINRYRER